jgi:hypothetical protein
MRNVVFALIIGALLIGGASRTGAAVAPHVEAATSIDAGRYLVIVTGCNHCHTQGWEQSDGHTPQSQWLLGSHAPGPGGQASPNLRAIVASMPRSGFIALLRRKQPPGQQMPFFNVRMMSNADLNAIYDFTRSLK